jgi:hypothetical protein
MMVFAGDLWVKNEQKASYCVILVINGPQVGNDNPYNFGIL